MDPTKRKIILQEIEHWRQSKLLPEQYCDFLRNLYLDPSVQTNEPESTLSVRKWGRRSSWYLFGIISFIFLIVLYFTMFLPAMQIALSILLVGILLGLGLFKRNKQPLSSFALLGAGCLSALVLGYLFIAKHGADSSAQIVAWIAVCGILWTFVGVVARIGILQLAGYFALLLSYLWLIQSLHPSPGWFILQVYLVPVSLLLYFIGKYRDKGIHSPGAMLLFASAFVFHAPEAYGLLFTDISGWILQPALAFKMAITGVVIWTRRQGTKEQEAWLEED